MQRTPRRPGPPCGLSPKRSTRSAAGSSWRDRRSWPSRGLLLMGQHAGTFTGGLQPSWRYLALSCLCWAASLMSAGQVFCPGALVPIFDAEREAKPLPLPTEGCLSGRKGRSRTPLMRQRIHGFKSHTFRQEPPGFSPGVLSVLRLCRQRSFASTEAHCFNVERRVPCSSAARADTPMPPPQGWATTPTSGATSKTPISSIFTISTRGDRRRRSL